MPRGAMWTFEIQILIGVDYFEVFVDIFCEFFACRPVPLFFGWSVRAGALTGDLWSIIIQNTYMSFSTLLLLLLTANGIAIAIIIGITSIIVVVVVVVVVVIAIHLRRVLDSRDSRYVAA